MRISELLSFTKSNDNHDVTINTISIILNEIIEDNKEDYERQSNNSILFFVISQKFWKFYLITFYSNKRIYFDLYYNTDNFLDSFNCSNNGIRSNPSTNKSIFHCKKPPRLDIKSYIERIRSYTVVEKSTLITCLLYIDRLCNNNGIKLNRNNVHK